MRKGTSIKLSKLLLSVFMIIVTLSTTLSIPIVSYATEPGEKDTTMDSEDINNTEDTPQTTPNPSGPQKQDHKTYICIYSSNMANRNNAFWVMYIADKSGNMVTDPYIVFPEGTSTTLINGVLNSNTALLKCHLDTSVAVTHYISTPIPGLPAPYAMVSGRKKLTDALKEGAIDHYALMESLCGGDVSQATEILETNPDNYYLVAEVAALTSHTSAGNPQITKHLFTSSDDYLPWLRVTITRRLPDGVTGFHVSYDTVAVTPDTINTYIGYWVNRYYNGEQILGKSLGKGATSKQRTSMENWLKAVVIHRDHGVSNLFDPRRPIRIWWDGDYVTYSATCLGWSMDPNWWDSDQAYLWNYWYPAGNFLGKNWDGLPAAVVKGTLGYRKTYVADIGNPALGWGMAAIRIHDIDGGGSSIDTYDYPNSPDVPARCEYPTPGEKSGLCTIVKHYWEQKPDGTYEQVGTFTRDLCSNNIHISDETDKTGYTIIGWWATNGYKSNDNPTPLDPVRARRITEAQNGDGEASVTLNTNINENTLVVVFLKTSDTTDVTGDYIIRQSQIAQRNSFDKIPALKTLMNHTFTWTRGAHNTTCGGHLVCPTPEHTHGTGCYAPNLTGIGTHLTCPQGEHTHGSGCYDTCKNWGFKDWNILLGARNIYYTSYPSILSSSNEVATLSQTTNQWITTNTSSEAIYNGKRDVMTADSISGAGYHYNFIIFRGKDYLTLAKWKNDGYNSNTGNFLGSISNSSTYNFKSQNTPANTRASSSYTDSFTAVFGNGTTHNGSDTRTAVGPNTGASNGAKCGDRQLFYGLNSNTGNFTATVGVQVYWAKSEPADLPISADDIPQNEVNSSLKAGTVSFIPYIMMRYDNKTQDNVSAAVLSQRTSNGIVTATFYDFIDYEIDHNFDHTYAINITSTQWSTHRTAAAELAEFFGGTAPSGSYIANGFADQSILPGGAVFTIGIPNDKVRTVTVKTMQAYLPSCGSGYAQVNNTVGASGIGTGIATSNTTILQNHRDLVDSAIAEWQKTEIREYLSVTPSLTTSATSSAEIKTYGKELFGDIDINVLKDDSGSTMVNHTNSDTKYYFGGDYSETLLDACYAVTSGNSNTSDASYEASTSRLYLTFFTNVYGQVCCKKGTTESSAILPANITACVPGGDIILVADARSNTIVADPSSAVYEVAVTTDVVRSLRQCTASQRGYDTECPWGLNWYNEAFDGITYIYQKTEFKVGLWSPALRDTVLDPAVTPYQENKDDFFTRFHAMALNSYKESTNFSESPFSNNAGNTFMLNYNFSDLYGSTIFYIPNVTTQDLN